MKKALILAGLAQFMVIPFCYGLWHELHATSDQSVLWMGVSLYWIVTTAMSFIIGFQWDEASKKKDGNRE